MSNFGSYNVDAGAVRRNIEKGGKKSYKADPKPTKKVKQKSGLKGAGGVKKKK
jgi:hypothetical protein